MDKRELITALRKFKKNIEKKYEIKKMILFGSRSGKDYTKDSDADIMIVSGNFEKVKSFKRAVPLYDYWDIDLPVDFICYTPEEYKKLAKRITIVREAERNGIEIK